MGTNLNEEGKGMSYKSIKYPPFPPKCLPAKQLINNLYYPEVNPKKSNSIALVFLSLFLVGLGTSCTKNQELSIATPENPTVLASEGCPESTPGIADYTLLTVPGWDVVAEVFYVTPPAPPESCKCVEDEFCIFLNFPQYAAAGFTVGISSGSQPATQQPQIVLPDGNGGYVNHNPKPFPMNPHLSMNFLVNNVPAPYWHKICDNSDSFIIYFNYPDYMDPSDYPAAPIALVSGICIVTNIGDL